MDAVKAYEAVPNKEPVMPPFTFKLPVIITKLEENTSSIDVLPVTTENNDPELVSSIVKILPLVPVTVNNPDPLPAKTNDPDTVELFCAMTPLRAINSFAIYVLPCFTIHKARVLYK